MGRGHCYLALDAKNRTKAIAISRMKTIRMATALLIRLRRAERMVEGQPCRSVILPFPIPCNLFPHMMSDDAATPNEPERGFFISSLLAIRIAWTGFEGASAHRQPQGMTQSVYTLRMLSFGNLGRPQISIRHALKERGFIADFQLVHWFSTIA